MGGSGAQPPPQSGCTGNDVTHSSGPFGHSYIALLVSAHTCTQNHTYTYMFTHLYTYTHTHAVVYTNPNTHGHSELGDTTCAR